MLPHSLARERGLARDAAPTVTRAGATSANWGQIIGYYWFYPLLLAIIGYYCNYWLLLAIIFLQKVFILLAIIATGSIINYCNYCVTIIAIIGSAGNYWH
jgi:hypothetical protein